MGNPVQAWEYIDVGHILHAILRINLNYNRNYQLSAQFEIICENRYALCIIIIYCYKKPLIIVVFQDFFNRL